MSSQLAQRGTTVVLTARDLEKAESAAGELAGEGLEARARPLDVSGDQSVRRLADDLDAEFGTLYVLVNNAAAYAD